MTSELDGRRRTDRGSIAVGSGKLALPCLVKDLQNKTKKGFGAVGTALKKGYHGEPITEKASK